MGYQCMPAAQLPSDEVVQLAIDLAELLGNPGRRVLCEMCVEEIMNGREVPRAGRRLFRACAGPVWCPHLEADSLTIYPPES